MISLFARRNFTVKQVMACLRKSGIYGEIIGYYKARGLGKADLHEYIKDSLLQRRLVGKAA